MKNRTTIKPTPKSLFLTISTPVAVVAIFLAALWQTTVIILSESTKGNREIGQHSLFLTAPFLTAQIVLNSVNVSALYHRKKRFANFHFPILGSERYFFRKSRPTFTRTARCYYFILFFLGEQCFDCCD